MNLLPRFAAVVAVLQLTGCGTPDDVANRLSGAAAASAPETQAQASGSVPVAPFDPLVALREIVPQYLDRASASPLLQGEIISRDEATFDVQQTTSLVTPYTGVIRFGFGHFTPGGHAVGTRAVVNLACENQQWRTTTKTVETIGVDMVIDATHTLPDWP